MILCPVQSLYITTPTLSYKQAFKIWKPQKAEIMESQHKQQQLPEPGKGTTFLRTCFNGINALSGVGILSIPYALSQGGWLSLILLFSVAILCWYTGLLLQRCMDSNLRINSYPDIGELAFGLKGRNMVSIFMYLELYLVAVEFLILEGDNLDKLFPNTGIKIASLKIHGKQCFVMLTALVILPTTWLRNMGVLAYVSAGGVLASVVVVVSVFWAGVDGVGFDEKGQLLNWSGMPSAMSLFAFCYCGHAVFPTLCNSMKDRSQFSKVLLVCFVLSTITYGSMAVLGYLMYGNNLMSQITLNLPIKKTSSKIAIYTTLINPLTKYAIIISPIAEAIEETFLFKNSSRCISYLIRTILVISTVVVAVTIPFFGYVMAFTGAFLSVTVSMMFPCLCYLKINKASRRFGLDLMIIVGVLVVGPMVAVLGTYSSVTQIVKHYK